MNDKLHKWKSKGKVDFRTVNGFLKSDNEAKHLTPINDAEVFIADELFAETTGWNNHINKESTLP